MEKQGQGVRLNLSAKLPDSETDQNKLFMTNSPSYAYLDLRNEFNQRASDKLNECALYECEDRIVQLDYDILIWDIFHSIDNKDQKTTLIKFREIEILQYQNEIELKLKESKLDVVAPVLNGDNKKMTVLYGPVTEVAQSIGYLFYSAKNIDGDHLYRDHCTTLAHLICDSFVSDNNERFAYLTMLKHVGAGHILVREEEEAAQQAALKAAKEAAKK